MHTPLAPPLWTDLDRLFGVVCTTAAPLALASTAAAELVKKVASCNNGARTAAHGSSGPHAAA
jgi:hypothetical protein